MVQWVKVSYTTSPVTQVADTDVNNAPRKVVSCPDFVDMGSINNKAPTIIIQKKPSIIVFEFVNLLLEVCISFPHVKDIYISM